jgi:hypothetical protein
VLASLERAEVVATALAGGGCLSRTEFMALLESNGISTAAQRGYHVIFVLCQRRLICWGRRAERSGLSYWVATSEVDAAPASTSHVGRLRPAWF